MSRRLLLHGIAGAQVPQAGPPLVSQTPQTPSVLPLLHDSSEVVKGLQVPPSSPAKSQSHDEKSASSKKKHELRIDATDRVWLRVVIDGKENKQMTLNEGDTVSFGADESVALTVGNAAGARILFDGKSFENLGADGQVVNLVFPSSGSPVISKQPAPVQPGEPVSPEKSPGESRIIPESQTTNSKSK